MGNRTPLKDRLQAALDMRNMKAADLCQKTGIPKGAVSYYLSGKSEPKADRLYIMCKALDVAEAWMLGYDVPIEKSLQRKNVEVIPMNDLGKLIKDARLAKGLTQEQLGNLVGVQKSAIAKYESGRVVNIKRSTLQGLAKALDLRGSDLIIESNPKAAASLSARVLSDDDLREVVELYLSLNNEDKQAYKELLKRLAK